MNWINERFPADEKAVLRYSSLLSETVSPDLLAETSQLEGFRLIELQPYDGVRILVLDESTRMQTGTYKSLDGCTTTAICRGLGENQIAFSSGANAGTALTHYGQRLGMETFFFCPPTTLYKIRGELFENPHAHLICVEGTDRQVKKATRIFEELTGIRAVPHIEWRFLASGVRGMFLAEQLKLHNIGFDWFAQAICAGFGPIGMYRILCRFVENGILPKSWLPGFLGIQQSALSPIATAWKNGDSTLEQPQSWDSGKPIEPGLYNTHPKETYEQLAEILTFTEGDMVTVEYHEYEDYRSEYTGRLEAAGIHLTVHPETKDYLERAGILAGAGMLKAIRTGKVAKGQTVVCSLSGGTGPAPVKPANPEYIIRDGSDLTMEIRRYVVERLGTVERL